MQMLTTVPLNSASTLGVLEVMWILSLREDLDTETALTGLHIDQNS